MSAVLTVAGSDSRELDRIVVTLPLSLARAPEGERADLHTIPGGPDWPDRAVQAIERGAAGLLLVRPVLVDAAAVEAVTGAASHRGVRVVVERTWAADPMVPAAAERVRAATVGDARLEVRVVAPTAADFDQVVLDQLGLVRALLGPVAALTVLGHSRHAVLVETAAGGTAVDLVALRSDAGPATASVRLVTVDGSVELDLAAPDTARPARLVRITEAGAVTDPTLYESAHRACWRRLHCLVTTRAAGDELGDWGADAARLPLAAGSRTARTAL